MELTIIHQKNDDLENALDDFSIAIQLKPNNANAYYRRSIVLLLSKSWNEAKADLMSAKSIRIDKEDPMSTEADSMEKEDPMSTEVKRMDVAEKFKEEYGSIEHFEQNTDITFARGHQRIANSKVKMKITPFPNSKIVLRYICEILLTSCQVLCIFYWKS